MNKLWNLLHLALLT